MLPAHHVLPAASILLASPPIVFWAMFTVGLVAVPLCAMLLAAALAERRKRRGWGQKPDPALAAEDDRLVDDGRRV